MRSHRKLVNGRGKAVRSETFQNEKKTETKLKGNILVAIVVQYESGNAEEVSDVEWITGLVFGQTLK